MSEETANDPAHVCDAYHRMARGYAEQFLGELEHKPLDRALLDLFAADVIGRGPVLDLATGPGQTTRYLHERDVAVTGVDLAPGMIDAAREAHPDALFRTGDMTALDAPDASLGGIVCFYGIVHFTRAELPSVFREWHRALAPGSPVLLAFHLGHETVRVPEMFGERIDLAWNFFGLSEVVSALGAAGLEAEIRIEREPYVGEHPSERGYVLARRVDEVPLAP